MPIQSFADDEAKQFFETGKVGKKVLWQGVKKIVLRKLDMLHYAVQLKDLCAPPGNRLEALKGNLEGYYSIRINDQWRFIFQWGEKGPEAVRVTDYH